MTPLTARQRLFAWVVTGLLLTVGACSTPIAPDLCEETKEPNIEPIFKVHFVVIRDSLPYANAPVEVVFEKHYCNGTVSGVFQDFGQTNARGEWTPVITPQYKLANSEDRVFVRLTANSVLTQDQELRYDTIARGLKLDDLFRVAFETTLTYPFFTK